MYFWNSYPFVRLSVAFIIGIIVFEHFPTYRSFLPEISFFLIILFSCSVYFSRKNSFYKLRHINGVLALLTIAFLGGIITKLHYHSYSPTHYTNQNVKVKGFSGTIVSPGSEKTNYYRYNFRLDQIAGDTVMNSSGLIHLYIRKDSSSNVFTYGDQFLVKGSFYAVPHADNSSEFDYKKYLEYQGIYAHAFVNFDQIKFIGNSPPRITLKLAYLLREKAGRILDKNILESRENGIAKALLIGIKDHLDNDIKQTYSSAGVMHVLAVSGLHVGIVYLILKLLFGGLMNRSRRGKKIFGLVSIPVIWLYAMITGLSPSVMRAATMFSLVAMSQASDKESNIYNTLGLAGFLLLIYDPYLIYSVGFQLSFAAVLGIVYLQPKIYRIFDFRIWLIDKAWAITCVSIAAQLATFPLSVYYFHQFPTYFLISNLVVIPAVFLLLVLGISMLLLGAIIPVLGTFLGVVLQQTMWIMNEFIIRLEKMPNNLIEWIYMDKNGLILTYGIILTLITGFHYKSFKTILTSFLIGFIFIGWTLKSNIEQSVNRQLIFYKIKDKTVIDYIEGHRSYLHIDNDDLFDLEQLSFRINPYRLSLHLRPIQETIKNSFQEEGFHRDESMRFGEIGGQKILIIDSTTFHFNFKNLIETDILLIEKEAIKNMKWLKNHIAAEHYIIGNRNSNYYAGKMKKQAAEAGLKIHSLKKDGSLILNLNKEKKE